MPLQYLSDEKGIYGFHLVPYEKTESPPEPVIYRPDKFIESCLAQSEGERPNSYNIPVFQALPFSKNFIRIMSKETAKSYLNLSSGRREKPTFQPHLDRQRGWKMWAGFSEAKLLAHRLVEVPKTYLKDRDKVRRYVFGSMKMRKNVYYTMLNQCLSLVDPQALKLLRQYPFYTRRELYFAICVAPKEMQFLEVLEKEPLYALVYANQLYYQLCVKTYKRWDSKYIRSQREESVTYPEPMTRAEFLAHRKINEKALRLSPTLAHALLRNDDEYNALQGSYRNGGLDDDMGVMLEHFDLEAALKLNRHEQRKVGRLINYVYMHEQVPRFLTQHFDWVKPLETSKETMIMLNYIANCTDKMNELTSDQWESERVMWALKSDKENIYFDRQGILAKAGSRYDLKDPFA